MVDEFIKVNTADLRRMARDLEKTVPGLKKEVAETIAEAAGLVKTEAQALASFSTRIPGSIRVVGTMARVAVRAGDDNAPHAAAFENDGVAGSFRHPVFGNREVWVSQKAHPFLHPAAARKGPEMEARLQRGVADVFAAAGF